MSLLGLLGLVEPDTYRLTERGKHLVKLPIHPRVGAILSAAKEEDLLKEGALLAALLSERELLALSQEEAKATAQQNAIRAEENAT